MNNIIQSAGFIVFTYVDGKLQFLLLRYTDGHWDFPKGKLEQKESLQQAAVRELFEETGLEVKKLYDFKTNFGYSFVSRSGIERRKEVTLFLAQVDTVSITLSHEHVGYKWCDADSTLAQLTYSNAQKAFLGASDYLQNRRNNEYDNS